MLYFWLRSAVGERKQWSADGETDGTESERNAAAEPQTEARRACGTARMAARNERAVLRSGTGVVGRHTVSVWAGTPGFRDGIGGRRDFQ